MPSEAARPPWPIVLSEKESTSATASFHCDSPAQIWDVCWLPGAAAICCQRLPLENAIFANALCVAQRVCMPMNTQQLVAANLSGFRMIPSGKTKSIGANVVLQIDRS